MRLLIMASVSLDTVICPAITSCTRSFSQTFPLVRSSALWPIRPSSAMRSKRLRVSAAVSTVGWDCVADLGSAGMSALLFLNGVDTGFRAGLAQQFLVLDDFGDHKHDSDHLDHNCCEPSTDCGRWDL